MTMPIDTRKVILAAVEAALADDDSDTKKKQRGRGLSAGRALLVGAGLMTVGRLAVGSRGREVMETLQERLGEFEDRFLSDDEESEEPEDEADDEEHLDEGDEDEESEQDEEEVADERAGRR